MVDPKSAQHLLAKRAVACLRKREESIFITPQNIIEFGAVATRPVDANGFGWDAPRALHEVNDTKTFSLVAGYGRSIRALAAFGG